MPNRPLRSVYFALQYGASFVLKVVPADDERGAAPTRCVDHPIFERCRPTALHCHHPTRARSRQCCKRSNSFCYSRRRCGERAVRRVGKGPRMPVWRRSRRSLVVLRRRRLPCHCRPSTAQYFPPPRVSQPPLYTQALLFFHSMFTLPPPAPVLSHLPPHPRLNRRSQAFDLRTYFPRQQSTSAPQSSGCRRVRRTPGRRVFVVRSMSPSRRRTCRTRSRRSSRPTMRICRDSSTRRIFFGSRRSSFAPSEGSELYSNSTEY